MQYLRLSVGLLMIMTAIPAIQAQNQPSQPSADASGQASQASNPADNGPAVDGARVTGSTFQSEFFKLTYQLPKDWKAMDDAARMAANQRQREQDADTARVRVPTPGKKRPLPAKPAPETSAVPQFKPIPLDTYNLMAASPTGVDSLGSLVLPRINIWAHHRFPSLSSIDDHAQFLVSTRRGQVVIAPQKMTIDGHEFERADIITPTGEYRCQIVTAVNDYLVGFEFHAHSQEEASGIIETIKTVKFQ